MKTNLTAHFLICILLFPLLGEAQLSTISGTVTSGNDGKALKDVTVFEVKSNTGTITDDKGYFKLELASGAVEISITDEGHKAFNRKFELKNDTTFAVKLIPEIQVKNRHKKQMAFNTSGKPSGKRIKHRR